LQVPHARTLADKVDSISRTLSRLKEKKQMYRKSVDALRSLTTKLKVGRAALPALLLICLAGALTTTRAQSNVFNSGSTGADGAFAPTTSQTIALPESGVFNFTTVNIPQDVFITFARNSKNTPVTILASGNITIGGQIYVSGTTAPSSGNGAGGLGGLGGFDGGFGGCDKSGGPQSAGTAGDGPGGGGGGTAGNNTEVGHGGGAGFSVAGGNGVGSQNAGRGGPRYGTSALLPLIGGSGGGGAGSNTDPNNGATCGGGGGGGGGAILIASSGVINMTFPGGIFAEGGRGNANFGAGGGGSGGAIRLVANTITGNGQLRATGGDAIFAGTGNAGKGSNGYLRVEAYDYRNFSPIVSGPQPVYALPNPIKPSNEPRLRIASVGGVPAPSAPLGAMHAPPDIVLPTTQTGPLEVVIEANNITVGTVLSVTVTPERGARTTVQSGGLSGSEAASTARVNVSLPSGVSVISATAIVDLTTAGAQPLFIDGERVTRMEVAATFGGASEVTYVTSTGRRVKKTGE
jgi:hypothetical protein